MKMDQAENHPIALGRMICGLVVLCLLLFSGSVPASEAPTSPLEISLENRGWLGLGYHVKRLEDGTAEGQNWLFVHRIVPEGPSDSAGLRPGDIISQIDGEPIEFESGLDSLDFFARIQPRQTVRFQVIRGGEPLEIQVEAGPMTEEMYEAWKKVYRRTLKSPE